MSDRKIRCAIYTRKSSDEGLDQAFNSLDAQREACAAYIASQRHEGWNALAKPYDDGGLSGGTLDRPALQRLLTDIDAGRIGMVVVYKIDRLTRSLTDFAKLVDRLDVADCSFVSVTQAFNTSTSMGRLTLNVLLSFAQFEREVTAERIRDKIAASKKKGLWMGGALPLGYDRHPDPQRQELIINPNEARIVTTLFEFYDDRACLSAVCSQAARQDLRSKLRTFASGRTSGGGPFSRGQIYYLLRNPVYRGLIRHRDQTYAGKHPAIIDETLWSRVQEKLEVAARRPRGKASSGRSNGQAAAPFLGKIRDETGDRLTPTHTIRHGRRHHYYVSNRLISGGPDPSGWRLPAKTIERAIVDLIARHIKKHTAAQSLLTTPDARQASDLTAIATDLIQRFRNGSSDLIADLLDQARIGSGSIRIDLNAECLADHLELDAALLSPALFSFEAPFQTRRRGVETKIIAGERTPAPDPTLIRTLSAAHEWARLLQGGVGIMEIAARTGHSGAFIRTRAQLAFLAPKLQAAILDGTQPADLTLKRILSAPVPLDWDDQAQRFGLSNA